MLLREFCTTDVISCERATTVLQAAEIMRRKHVGDLVVVDSESDGRTPVGILTDRDIVVRVVGNELDPGRVTVGEIMRTPIVVGNENEGAADAIARMRFHGVRRLPIIGGRGHLVGIVTMDDLLRLLISDTSALLEVAHKEQDREQRSIR